LERRHPARTRLVLVALATLAITAVAAPAGISAASEPNGNASCIGLEQASISPPGSSDELPDGAPQFVGEVKELAVSFGVRPGTLFSFIAHLHAGSHAACDEALEG
jgi:hypothetical protein